MAFLITKVGCGVFVMGDGWVGVRERLRWEAKTVFGDVILQARGVRAPVGGNETTIFTD